MTTDNQTNDSLLGEVLESSINTSNKNQTKSKNSKSKNGNRSKCNWADWNKIHRTFKDSKVKRKRFYEANICRLILEELVKQNQKPQRRYRKNTLAS